MSISTKTRCELELAFVNPEMATAREAEPFKKDFTFIDLFAGTGGFRHALGQLGGKCLLSSEIDQKARENYKQNFGEYPSGDITKIDPASIPDHDILTGGFPCQTFSMAGVAKLTSLGRKHGMEDENRGQLILSVHKIVEAKRPPMFLLENVKGLLFHEKGLTLNVILDLFTDLGYVVFPTLLSSATFVPQHRERVFLIGFDSWKYTNESITRCWKGVEIPKVAKVPELKDILEANPDEKTRLTIKSWEKLLGDPLMRKPDGFQYKFDLNSPSDITKTKMRDSGGWHAIYVKDNLNLPPRGLTPRECARLFGYPETSVVPKSIIGAQNLFGNAVVVPLVKLVAETMLKAAESFEINTQPTQPKRVEELLPRKKKVNEKKVPANVFTDDEVKSLLDNIVKMKKMDETGLAQKLLETEAEFHESIQKSHWYSRRAIVNCIMDGAILTEAMCRNPGGYTDWVRINSPFCLATAAYRKVIFEYVSAQEGGLAEGLKKLPTDITVRKLRELSSSWKNSGRKGSSSEEKNSEKKVASKDGKVSACMRNVDSLKRAAIEGSLERDEAEKLLNWLVEFYGLLGFKKAA